MPPPSPSFIIRICLCYAFYTPNIYGLFHNLYFYVTFFFIIIHLFTIFYFSFVSHMYITYFYIFPYSWQPVFWTIQRYWIYEKGGFPFCLFSLFYTLRKEGPGPLPRQSPLPPPPPNLIRFIVFFIYLQCEYAIKCRHPYTLFQKPGIASTTIFNHPNWGGVG